MLARRSKSSSSRPAKTLWVLVSGAALSCSAVLGLDEPTLRGQGQPGAGGDAVGSGAGGASNGGAGGGSAGDVGVAGSQASGGASMAGAAGDGGAGPGGAGGAAPSPDGGGAGAARDAAAEAGPKGCASLPLCDDFEGQALNAVPDLTKWQMDAGILVVIDGTRFASGKQSARPQLNGASTPAMFYNKAPLTIGNVWYVRLNAFITELTGRGGIMAIHDQIDAARSLVLTVNANGLVGYSFTQFGSLGNQTLIPNGAAQLLTSAKVVAATWFCVEMRFDWTNKTIQTWFNGTDIPVLHADGVSTAGIDDMWMTMPTFQPQPFVRFGWWSASTPSPTVYVDDVAVAPSRIGCN